MAPQGRKGDGGNDGYLPAEKHYFQVHAPIDPKVRVTAAARKLVVDFRKILKTWAQDGKGIDAYSFVFNDKYQGVPLEIEQTLNVLRVEHDAISCAHYCCRDLEADFIGLDEKDWDRILGMPFPDPSRISHLEYSVLGEVVRFIMSTDMSDSDTRFDLPPELYEKIRLNGLSSSSAARIQSGALAAGHIDKYFQAARAFALDELRDHVVGHYETAKQVVATSDNLKGVRDVDTVFRLFRATLFPKNATMSTSAAVDAIIGYFFECCDVFDPNSQKGLPGASP